MFKIDKGKRTGLSIVVVLLALLVIGLVLSWPFLGKYSRTPTVTIGKKVTKAPVIKVKGSKLRAVSWYSLDFSKDLKQPVKFRVGSKAAISFKPVILSPKGDVAISKNKVTYKNVYKNTDLERLTTSQGLKQNYILKAPGHPTTFKEALSTSLTIKEESDGSLGYYDGAKKLAFSPKPYLVDAKGKKVNLDYQLSSSPLASRLLTLTLPDLKGLAYPIKVDPSVLGDVPGGDLIVDGTTYTISGDHQGANAYKSITIQNGGILNIQSNDTTDGAVIDVNYTGGTGKVWVTGNSSIIPRGYYTVSTSPGYNGRGVTINAVDIQIDSGSSINANGQGYPAATGPGKGGNAGNTYSGGGGGGYGGAGAAGYSYNGGGGAGGAAYDANKEVDPTSLGSGGGNSSSGTLGAVGGGAIKLVASSTLQNDGVITANSSSLSGGTKSGGGSGGSILIGTNLLKGTGSITANGGSSSNPYPGGAGGGGHIAIYYGDKTNWTGSISKIGGTYYGTGQAGSLVFQSNNLGVYAFSNQAKLDGTTPLKTGERTDETGIKLSFWYLGEAGVTQYFTPEVEVKPTGTPFDGTTNIYTGSQVSTTDSLYRAIVTVLSGSLTNGVAYHWRARIKSPDGNPGPWSAYGANPDGDGMTDGSPANADFEVNTSSPGGGTSYPNLTVNMLNSNLTNTQSAIAVYQNNITLMGPYTLTFGNGSTFQAEGDLKLQDNNTNLTMGTSSALRANNLMMAPAGSANRITIGSGTFKVNNGVSLDSGKSIIATSNLTLDIPTVSLASGSTLTTGNNPAFQTSGISITGGSLTVGNNFNYSNPLALTSGNLTIGANSAVNTSSAWTVNGSASIGGNSSVTLGGNLWVTNNSTLTVKGYYTTDTNGRGVTINATDIQVDAGSKINADVMGYAANAGPGAGASRCSGSCYGSGAGYGASGGDGYGGPAGGIAYGSASNPIDLGSGGGNAGASAGGYGGGAIKLITSGTLTNNGIITAVGGNGVSVMPWYWEYSGGGAGGSIYLYANSLIGSGTIRATGGNGGSQAGGGAGGRIAVYYGSKNWTGTISKNGGNGYNAGQDGTLMMQSNNLAVAGFSNQAKLNATTPLKTGEKTNETGINLSFWYLAEGGTNSSAFTPEVEVKPVGTVFNGTTNLYTGSQVSTTDSLYRATVTIPSGSLTNGAAYHWRARIKNGAGIPGSWYAYGNNPSGNGTTDGSPANTDFEVSTTAPGGGTSYPDLTVDMPGNLINSQFALLFYQNNVILNGAYTLEMPANANLNINGNLTLLGSVFKTNTNTVVNAPNANVSGAVNIGSSSTVNFNNLTINSSSSINGNTTLNLANKLWVTNNSTLAAKGYYTVSTSPGYNGRGVTVNATDIQVDVGSAINADGRGYPGGAGPAKGNRYNNPNYVNYISGGGYGGKGADSGSALGGQPPYGSATMPVDLGSGTYYDYNGAGPGGGAIKLKATGTLTNNGSIMARGANGIQQYLSAGGGAGGSIWLDVGTLTGSGTISAKGGNGFSSSYLYGAGGGGGRIAIYYGTKNWTGTPLDVASLVPVGSGGTNGENGSFFMQSNNLAVAGFSNQAKLNATTPLKTGEKTNETGINLSFWYLAEGGTNSSVFTPEVEVKPVGTAFNGTTNLYTGSQVSTTDSLYRATVTIPSSSLTNGVAYHWRARIKNLILNSGPWAYYGSNSDGDPANGINADTDFMIDTTAPGGGTTYPDLILALINNVNNTQSIRFYQNNMILTGPYLLTLGNNSSLNAIGNLSLTGTNLTMGNNSSITSLTSDLTTNLTLGSNSSVSLNSLVGSLNVGSNSVLNLANLTTNSASSIGGNSTVNLAGKLWLANSSTLTAKGYYTTGTNGRGVSINAADVQIDTGSKISADGQGYGSATGSGKAPDHDVAAGGAGYGGAGGAGGYGFRSPNTLGGPGGPSYGSLVQPLDLGSGGGNSINGNFAGGGGGGTISLRVNNSLINNGAITTIGGTGAAGMYLTSCPWGACTYYGAAGGGGSGGGIFIKTDKLQGNGSVNVTGGNGGVWARGGNSDVVAYGGGGAGGRIALYFSDRSLWTGSFIKGSGSGYQGGSEGTLYMQNTDVYAFSNQAKLDASTPLKTGAKTNETGIKLSFWYWAANNTTSVFTPEVEIKPINQAFNGTSNVFTGSQVTTTDTFYRATVTVPSGALTNGTAYHWRARFRSAIDESDSWYSYGDNSDGDPAGGINAATDFEVDTSLPAGGGSSYPDLTLNLDRNLSLTGPVAIYQNNITLTDPYTLTFGNGSTFEAEGDLKLQNNNTNLTMGTSSALRANNLMMALAGSVNRITIGSGTLKVNNGISLDSGKSIIATSGFTVDTPNISLGTGSTLNTGNNTSLRNPLPNTTSLTLMGGNFTGGSYTRLYTPTTFTSGAISLGANSVITINALPNISLPAGLTISMGDNAVIEPPSINISGGSLTAGNNFNYSNPLALTSGNLTIGANSAVNTSSAWTVNGSASIGGNSSVTLGGNLLVTNNSTLTAKGYYTTDTNGRGVTINAANIQVDAGSAINSDAQGYAANAGPGKGAVSGSVGGGAGYGGRGGNGLSGSTSILGGSAYGSQLAPIDLGSSGGGSGTGGRGGGALKLVTPGALTVNGLISAKGENYVGAYGGGGSGGSIWFDVDTFAGNGTINADGGSGYPTGGTSYGGSGSGGRITLDYQNKTFFGIISANYGTFGGQQGVQTGKVYLSPGQLEAPQATALSSNAIKVILPYVNPYDSPLDPTLSITTYAIYNDTAGKYLDENGAFTTVPVYKTFVEWNAFIGVRNTGLDANKAYTYRYNYLMTDGTETVNNWSLPVTEYTFANKVVNLKARVDNNNDYEGSVTVVSGTHNINEYITGYNPSTGVTPVFDNLAIASDGILTTSPLVPLEFEVKGALTIENGGKIDVIGKGYSGGAVTTSYGSNPGSGPGGGTGGGGGGYGGKGGDASSWNGVSGSVTYGGGGPAYGAYPGPVTFGSGGSSGSCGCSYGGGAGGAGGGLIKVKTKSLLLYGQIMANGADGFYPSGGWGANGAGGSGGGIDLTVSNSSFDASRIAANGGAGNPGSTYVGSGTYNSGGGGGGRIVLHGSPVNSSSVSGGLGSYGSGSSAYPGKQGDTGSVNIDPISTTNETANGHKIDLSWEEFDLTNIASFYRVYYSKTNGGPWILLADNFTQTSLSFISKPDTYYFKVDAVNEVGEVSSSYVTSLLTNNFETEPVTVDTGTGAEGNLVVDGTTAANSTDGIKHDAANPLVLNGTHNYQNVTLQNNAVVTHTANNGGLLLNVTGTLLIDNTSKIDVSGRGYQAGQGPGTGSGGAGYGSVGGNIPISCSFTGSGPTYDSYLTPNLMGSGGGGSAGGAGGGRIEINSWKVKVAGSIQANGFGGQTTGTSSGGSGGSIWLKATYVDVPGYLSAAGGGGASVQETGLPGLNGSGGRGGNGSTGGSMGTGGLGGSPGLAGPGGNGARLGICFGTPATGGQGSSGGGGGSGSSNSGGGGGGAGRIAIQYRVYNGTGVNNGQDGFAASPGGTVGPYAYYSLLNKTLSYVPAPSFLSGVALSAETIKLSWANPAGNKVVGFKIYRNGQEIGQTYSAGEITFTDTGLDPGTEYRYFVKGILPDGNLTASSNNAWVTTFSRTYPPTGEETIYLDSYFGTLSYSTKTSGVDFNQGVIEAGTKQETDDTKFERSYFKFPLDKVTGPIASAKLYLDYIGVSGAPSVEEVNVDHVADFGALGFKDPTNIVTYYTDPPDVGDWPGSNLVVDGRSYTITGDHQGTNAYKSIIVKNGGILVIKANDTTDGAVIDVNYPGGLNTVLVTGNSQIIINGYYTSGTNGKGITINTSKVQVDAGSKITADEQGYPAAYGPGAGGSITGCNLTAGGAGYGGNGGSSSSAPGGLAYDAAQAANPTNLGSGGGNSDRRSCFNGIDYGSPGGGALKIKATYSLVNNGQISANSSDPSYIYSGSGSGGSIWVEAGYLQGSGNIMAKGGNNSGGANDRGGAGAGGRIAINYGNNSSWSGSVSAAGGTGNGWGGQPGQPGTISWLNTITPGLAPPDYYDPSLPIPHTTLGLRDWDILAYSKDIQPSKWLNKDTMPDTLTTDVTSQIEIDKKARLDFTAFRLRSYPELRNMNANYTFSTLDTARPRIVVKYIKAPEAPILTARADSPNQITANTVDNSTTEEDFHFLFSTDGINYTPDLFPVISDTEGGTGALYQKVFGSLLANTRYYVKGYAHDHKTDFKSDEVIANLYTQALTPPAPTITRTGTNYIYVRANPGANPSNTKFAIFNDTVGKYVQSDGSLADSSVYNTITDWGYISGEGWGTKINNGLDSGVTYVYKVRAQNGDGILTNWSAEAPGTTTTAPASPPPSNQSPVEKLPFGKTTDFIGGIEDGYINQDIYINGFNQRIYSYYPSTGTSSLTVGHQNGNNNTYSSSDRYRSFLTFDSSAIPDDAVITGAALYFKVSSINKTADSDIQVMYSNQPTWGTSLDASDWRDNLSFAGGKLNTSSIAAEGWYGIKIPLDSISKVGRSEYVLKDSRESSTTSYESMLLNLYSSNSTGNQPYLKISYLETNPATQIPVLNTLVATSNSQLDLNLANYTGVTDELHLFKGLAANPTVDTNDPIKLNYGTGGTGAQGDVVVTSNHNINEYIANYSPEDDIVPNFNNLTITSGSILTASSLAPLQFKVKGTLTVDTGGKIDASGKGYAGGSGCDNYVNNPGFGPGGGRIGRGGGYGGAGGNNSGNGGSGGASYGAYPDPVTFGSGGGCGQAPGSYPTGDGGAGGGIIKIEANSLVLNGQILNNGLDGLLVPVDSNQPGGAGGAGGGIDLTVVSGSFAADNISARGGNGNKNSGGGGGGRIAINGSVIGSPSVLGGLGWSNAYPGGSGTINTFPYQAPSLTDKSFYQLSTNTKYYIRSRAYDYTNGLASNYSNELAAYTLANVPTKPRVSNSALNSIKITLVNTDGNPSYTKYAIYNVTANKYVQADGSLADTAVYQTFAGWGGASGIVNTGLQSGTSYTYKIKAQNGDAVDSGWSLEASISTLAIAPTNLTATTGYNDTDGYFNQLQWQENNTSPVKYRVYYSINGGQSYQQAGGDISGTSYKHVGLKARTTYMYKVVAVNQDDQESSAITASVDTLYPAAPSNLTGQVRNAVKADLVWVAPTGPVTIAGYKIYRNDKAIADSPVNSYDDTGLNPNTIYQYYVRAYDNDGNLSGKSNTIEIKTFQAIHQSLSQDTSSCAVCHRSHTAIDTRLLVKIQKDVCYTCHDGTGSNFNVKSEYGEDSVVKTSRHPVPDRGINCGDCHDPHGTKDPNGNFYARLLRAKKAGTEQRVYQGNEFCGACHGPNSTLAGRSGEDHLSFFTGTSHDTLSEPASGTKIKCVNCHSKHATNNKPLLKDVINGSVISGNNNSVCYSCHNLGKYAYSGQDLFKQTKHSRETTGGIVDTSASGYVMGLCLNCHDPHGVAGTTDYRRQPKNQLCSTCHDAKSPPVGKVVAKEGRYTSPVEEGSVLLFSEKIMGNYPGTSLPLTKVIALSNVPAISSEDTFLKGELLMRTNMDLYGSMTISLNTAPSPIGATFITSWAPLMLMSDPTMTLDIAGWLNDHKGEQVYVILDIAAGSYGPGGSAGPTVSYTFQSLFQDNAPANTLDYFAYRGITDYNQASHGSTNNINTIWPDSSETGSGIGSGGSTAGECINCHNPHGKKDSVGKLIPKMLQEREEDTCFKCHDNPATSVRGINIKDRFTIAELTMGSSYGLAKASARHSVFNDNDGRQLECTDCHNPHLNNDKDKVVDPLNKTMLFTNKVIDPISKKEVPDYTAFCLKCHSEKIPMTKFGSGITTVNQVAMVDYANNYHGELDASGVYKAGQTRDQLYGPMKPPYRRGMGPLSCTTCHDEHGSSNVLHFKESVNGRNVSVPASGQALRGQNWSSLCYACHEEQSAINAHGDVNCGSMAGGCHNEGNTTWLNRSLPPEFMCSHCHMHYPPSFRNYGIAQPMPTGEVIMGIYWKF